MSNIMVEKAAGPATAQRPTELVERKGKGHPDTICDAVMEAACIRLCREYRERCCNILHHNLDKGLLVAGRTLTKPGGGIVIEQMRIITGDRATMNWKGTAIPVHEIVEAETKEWIRRNLRFVDPDRHVVFQHEIRPGSAELCDSFSRTVIGANDTSAGVGYAPLTETESVVLDTEHYLNSPACKEMFPETGEDVKIMGMRNGGRLELTIAVAFVDRFIASPASYVQRKNALAAHIEAFLHGRNRSFEAISLCINALDDPEREEGGMYLTVLGTSAEGADGGEVGRGNRVNGLIAFGRPSSLEAAAGKNPVSHVGKIYNVLARETASRIHREVPGVKELTVTLCSRIGDPVGSPRLASARILPESGRLSAAIRRETKEIMRQELSEIDTFLHRLASGEFMVY